MLETSRQIVQKHPANLAALHEKLKELASRAKMPSQRGHDRARSIESPSIVIRGK
jgi:hypothetical protein